MHVSWVFAMRNKNAAEKRVDNHDQQLESSQNLEHPLQPSHQARVAERNTRRHLSCETLSSRGAKDPEDGEMEFGTRRLHQATVTQVLTKLRMTVTRQSC